MTKQVAVGVDIGSSAARAVAISRAGEIVATARIEYPAGTESRGEIEPGIWFEGLCRAINSLDCPPPAAICAGGHGPTTVAATGELALTFRHPAGESSSPRDQHAAQAKALREILGHEIHPRQMWDWAIAQLGGDQRIQSVWTETNPLPDFGEPVPVGSVVGATNGSYGIPEGIPLVPGTNDGYATAWADGIDLPGKGFDPGGKTGGLGVAVAAGLHDDAATYGMPSAVAGVYIVGGPVASHGTILDWWAGITGRSIQELVQLAEEVEPGSRGVIALPYLEGERAPRWNRELRAQLVGLAADSDIATVTRALLEGTAYGLAHIAHDLTSQGIQLDRVVSSGGPVRSRLWTSIKASVLEVPFDVPACDEMAAYGAGLGAGAALDWWPRPGEGRPGDWPVPDMETVYPEPLPVYREGLQRFIALGDAAQAALETESRR